MAEKTNDDSVPAIVKASLERMRLLTLQAAIAVVKARAQRFPYEPETRAAFDAVVRDLEALK